jgi:hypothetical protein
MRILPSPRTRLGWPARCVPAPARRLRHGASSESDRAEFSPSLACGRAAERTPAEPRRGRRRDTSPMGSGAWGRQEGRSVEPVSRPVVVKALRLRSPIGRKRKVRRRCREAGLEAGAGASQGLRAGLVAARGRSVRGAAAFHGLVLHLVPHLVLRLVLHLVLHLPGIPAFRSGHNGKRPSDEADPREGHEETDERPAGHHSCHLGATLVTRVRLLSLGCDGLSTCRDSSPRTCYSGSLRGFSRRPIRSSLASGLA